MRTARTRITDGQHDVAGQLTLDVCVELLHPSLLEVQILRLQGSGKAGWNLRSRNRRQKTVSQTAVEGSCGNRIPIRTRNVREIVRFGQVRRVLPPDLCALLSG